jgi:NADH:ubiquinone oxidoreductase subunit 6 (subunit J)
MAQTTGMTELLFNAVWFVLLFVAVIALLRNRHSVRGRRQLMLHLGTLLCAAAILFPSISLSDDLHFQAFIVEDSKSTKRLSNAVAHANPIASLFWLAVAILALRFLAAYRRRWRVIESCPVSYRTPLFNRHLRGRAPPAIPAY